MRIPPVLQASHISKRFGDTLAVNDVCFDVLPGEIHALCGENGAGKSTLIKILSGFYPSGTFEGDLRFQGQPLRLKSIRDAEQIGVAVIHQELSLVDPLTVAENLFLGNLPRRGCWWDWPTTIQRSREMLRQFSVDLDPEATVADLGVGQQQLVEIARALARQPRLLILDEPTAALSLSEVELLLHCLRGMRQRQVACIYISHRLEEVQRIADRITILRDGKTVTTQPRERLPVDAMIRHMVGRDLDHVYPPHETSASGETALRVSDLSADSPVNHHVRLRRVSLEVRRGEILGIGGLMGAGRSELLMHLYGLWGRRQQGSVWIGEQPYPDPSPRESLQRGLVLITEDRKRFGLIPGRPARDNLSLSSLQAVSRWGCIDAIAEHRRQKSMLEKVRFRALSEDVPADRLSGGNQQKLVIARGLLTDPRIVLLDEPTRGVDVGAKREIYDQMRRLAQLGKAILWVSSELPELMGVSDRVVMMHQGTTVASFERREFDQDRLLAAATDQELPS